MLVMSTESDYANARYFSGFWPLFERAGVAISANGDAALLVGPECIIFAKDVGKIQKLICEIYKKGTENFQRHADKLFV
ncbi:MAG: hypothetical protein E7395_00890 [Ruminococcaceae bacterium]|nr:hypothetical protein [Oscillospiraceae bacterium]